MQYRLLLISVLVMLNLFPVLGVKNKKTILILHSYNQGLKWTDDLNRAITSEIEADSSFLSDFHIEYMDTKHCESEEYFRIYETYFLSKFKNTKFDLIISTDNAAFNFLAKHRDFLPGKPPVVFCGLNYVDSIPSGFTGLMEDIDVFSNIQAILKVHPDCQKLYLVVDRTITGNVIRKKFEKTIAESFSKLKHEYLTDLSITELSNKLSTLKPGEIVFLLVFNIDKNRTPISYDHILQILKPNCKVPIYGTWDFYLNKGIVGGKITKAATHGKYAAKIALRVLKGASTASIPIINGPTEFYYDNNVLKEFKISKSKLPSNAVVINTNISFLKENLLVVKFMLVVFLLMLILIIVLLKLINKEKQIRKEERMFIQELKNKSVELENALQLAEESNQLKTAFLANLSHEIRTPLNAIVGFSDLLANNNYNEKLAEYASIVKGSSSQLLSIISDIIEMSIVDTRQVTINYSHFNVNQAIEDVCSAFSAPTQHGPNMEFRKKLPLKGHRAVIKTDEVKFRQILTNLLSNAFKFTENGFVEVGYVVKNNFWEFYVKDSGIGIEPQFHEVIFERFRKVENSEKALFRGLGIGLPLSLSFVKFIGGEMWMESEIGKGSTFYFTIPCNTEVKTQEGKDVPKNDKLENRVILICEDDENNLLYFQALFNETNANVLWAKNGNEAVSICRKNPSIELVLMDLKMPGMNGWEAAKIIREMRPNLPIIAQTAYALSVEINQLAKKGFNDYITKPIRKSELFEKISNHLNM